MGWFELAVAGLTVAAVLYVAGRWVIDRLRGRPGYVLNIGRTASGLRRARLGEELREYEEQSRAAGRKLWRPARRARFLRRP